jgi:hypothetical protein
VRFEAERTLLDSFEGVDGIDHVQYGQLLRRPGQLEAAVRARSS